MGAMKRLFLLPVVLMIMSVSLGAQETKQVKTTKKGQDPEVVMEKGQIPVVIIDGKKYDSDILRLIDPDLIARVDVYKGEEAEKLYNEPAVVVVTTKDKANEKQQVKIRLKQPEKGTSDQPVFLIDGRVADPGELDAFTPDNIESITVLKDEKSKKKYKTESGVVLIVTKKKEVEGRF